MGDHNPRKRSVSHVELVGQGSSPTVKRGESNEALAEEGLAPVNAKDVEAEADSAHALSRRTQRTRGKRRSVAESGKVVDTGTSGQLPSVSGALAAVLEADDTLTEEEAAERAAAALERQARARQERIEREEAKERRRRRRRIIRRIVFVVLFVIVLAVAALVIAFGIFRWQTYDDAADIQGTWYHEDTTVPVTITKDEIELTDEVAYRYVLDPEGKTILFRFGNMEGAGRYRFSLDRTKLMIVDGEFDGMSTFIDDAIWTAESLMADLFSSGEVPLGTGASQETIFTRERPAN